jgi:hypothetical protein
MQKKNQIGPIVDINGGIVGCAATATRTWASILSMQPANGRHNKHKKKIGIQQNHVQSALGMHIQRLPISYTKLIYFGLHWLIT